MFYNICKRIILTIIMIVFLAPFWAQSQELGESSLNQKFKKEELAQMLAPIALYPDALLSQVLMAASYPFEVVEADKWLTKNPFLNGEALDNALKEKDWDVSILSICYYPKVLSTMAENLTWTASLGDAFADQQEEVMDTVQELRARAYAQGNVTTTPEQKVIVEERVIRIETVSPEYIYVPAYNPFEIYGPWWYPAYMPFRIFYPGVVVIGPRIVFSPRIHVGFGVFGWSAFNWRDRHMTIINIDRTKRFNRHANVYREVEHAPWRPDREKRFIREQRTREIPQYRPSVKSLKPGTDRKIGNKIITPRKSNPNRIRKPFIERNKSEKQVLDRKIAPKNKNFEIQSPVQSKPQVQVTPRPEKKDVIKKDKREREENDRGNERGGSSREGKK